MNVRSKFIIKKTLYEISFKKIFIGSWYISKVVFFRKF